jgi:hypothetical protein
MDKINDKIDSKVWKLLVIYGAGFLSLLAMMAKGFEWFQ